MGRRARVNRNEVLAAARTAFAERGYDGTTLSDIASRLGVSPAALLRHAAGKRELFTAAMAAPPAGDAFPLDFLRDVDARADPAPVLRRLAETAIPFIESQLAPSIAMWMYAKSADEARTLRLPFDPRSTSTPPRRAFALIVDYLGRARDAGRLRIEDPVSTALAFMGTMNAYVFFHRVVKLVDPPVPLPAYLDAVLGIWTRGAVPPPGSRKARRSRARRRASA